MLSVSAFATDYYVNGATGHDSTSCGAPADPCKSVEQAVKNTGDGVHVTKISEGTYVEDTIYVRGDATYKRRGDHGRLQLAAK